LDQSTATTQGMLRCCYEAAETN